MSRLESRVRDMPLGVSPSRAGKSGLVGEPITMKFDAPCEYPAV